MHCNNLVSYSAHADQALTEDRHGHGCYRDVGLDRALPAATGRKPDVLTVPTGWTIQRFARLARTSAFGARHSVARAAKQRPPSSGSNQSPLKNRTAVPYLSRQLSSHVLQIGLRLRRLLPALVPLSVAAQARCNDVLLRVFATILPCLQMLRRALQRAHHARRQLVHFREGLRVLRPHQHATVMATPRLTTKRFRTEFQKGFGHGQFSCRGDLSPDPPPIGERSGTQQQVPTGRSDSGLYRGIASAGTLPPAQSSCPESLNLKWHPGRRRIRCNVACSGPLKDPVTLRSPLLHGRARHGPIPRLPTTTVPATLAPSREQPT